MKTKEMKAITLISLAITIVILLILAGISINVVLGDNGIIAKAKQASSATKEAQAKEEINSIIFEFNLPNEYETLKDFLDSKEADGTIDKVTENEDETLKIEKNGYFVDNVENKVNSIKSDVKIKIIIDATPYEGKYDGTSHEAITSISTKPKDAQIEYSTDGINFSTVMPTITNASSVTVTIRVSKVGYETTTTDVIATIEKAEGKITLSETSGTSDKGTNLTTTVSENTGEISALSLDTSIATTSVSENTVTIIPGANTGTTTITVTSEESENYNKKSATYTVTINNALFTGESGVGYYADVDGNGTVDGIIFEDLKVGGSGNWGEESFSVTPIVETKEYYIVKKDYSGNYFGKKDVLAPVKNSQGKSRFYVMALSNYSSNSVSITVASNNIPSGWRIPTGSEWVMFGCNLKISSSNYKSYGLASTYWTSSRGFGTSVWYYVSLSNTSLVQFTNNIAHYYPCRYSTTF